MYVHKIMIPDRICGCVYTHYIKHLIREREVVITVWFWFEYMGIRHISKQHGCLFPNTINKNETSGCPICRLKQDRHLREQTRFLLSLNKDGGWGCIILVK